MNLYQKPYYGASVNKINCTLLLLVGTTQANAEGFWYRACVWTAVIGSMVVLVSWWVEIGWSQWWFWVRKRRDG
jgi:hypothetical protein